MTGKRNFRNKQKVNLLEIRNTKHYIFLLRKSSHMGFPSVVLREFIFIRKPSKSKMKHFYLNWKTRQFHFFMHLISIYATY